MFVLAPEAIRAAGTACERALPSTALLRPDLGAAPRRFPGRSRSGVAPGKVRTFD